MFSTTSLSDSEFQSIYEGEKRIRKQYEQERRTLQRKLSDRALSKTERQEIKSRLRDQERNQRADNRRKEKIDRTEAPRNRKRYTEKSKKLKRALRKRENREGEVGKPHQASELKEKSWKKRKTIDFGPRTEASSKESRN